MLKSFLKSKKKWEYLFIASLFLFLSAYLFTRANTVFYIHDELVSKWAYMISWNPFPYNGYIDANNHFLNSFFGGMFIHLFQSDSIWIVRLANLLTFPLFFWSIFGLRNFFTRRINFYWLLISLTCTAFIIEFFGMARGYGMSVAFMVFALQQTLMFFKTTKLKHYVIALIAWNLAVYSSITLIPIALFGIAYLALFLWRKKHKAWYIAIVLALLPIGYLVKYAFYLKEIGKLYCGGQVGFLEDTVHSLTSYIWNVEHLFLDVILVIVFISIAFTVLLNYLKSKNIFEARFVASSFYLVGVASILLQNWLLDVLFPEDRAVLFLVIFFFIGLCFTVDYWKIRWVPYPFILLTLIFFGFHFNFSNFVLFDYEHFDKELLTKTQDKVKGIPPSIGCYKHGWVDNELTREIDVPFRVVQLADRSSDTLEDYIIATLERRPDIENLYHTIHKDQISGLTLFERNHFLTRKKITENILKIDGTDEYNNLYNQDLTGPLFLRCSGVLENMNITKDAILVFSAENNTNKEVIYYQAENLSQSCPIHKNEKIYFDFTIAMNQYLEANQIKVFFWNKKKIKQKGEIKLEVYKVF